MASESLAPQPGPSFEEATADIVDSYLEAASLEVQDEAYCQLIKACEARPDELKTIIESDKIGNYS